MTTTTKIPSQLCAKCGGNFDLASNFDAPVRRPKPDDLNVCLYCGALYKFGADLRLVEMTAEEEGTLRGPEQLEVARVRLALRTLWKIDSRAKREKR